MRATLRPLEATGDAIPLTADHPIAPLWTRRLDWRCRERRLDLQVIAVEPLAVPEPEPTEPPEGAIARVERALVGTGALLLLRNPAEAFGEERIAYAEGARLIGIASEADEACWDAMLTAARPVYGVRGTLACEVMTPRATSVLSALAYGLFVAEEGLSLGRLEEDRAHVAWDCGRAEAAATVLIREGFEAGRIAGAAGEWRDRGSEGYVRVVVRAGGDACWTQPRFIAPGRRPERLSGAGPA
jgi:hypothetical protein